jgi:2-polyprenyl-3-methyl-5-hydroxy-6-metoxy-1,4-benzoquinol methylase
MDVAERAALSEGQSSGPIHTLVRCVVQEHAPGAGTLVDVGCGTGALARSLNGCVGEYVGCDVVRYTGFPTGLRFVEADLNRAPYPLEAASADVVACVETIEHLENPRLVVRELVRVVRPGGIVLVTTPNQLSVLSKLTLVLKNQFNAFLDGPYPAHITALVEQDLVRIARECGLEQVEVRFTDSGRIPGSAKHWPSQLGGGRAFSDNILVFGRRSLA